MRKTAHGLIAVAFLVLGATHAVAGIVDSPIPTLGGQTALHLYSVPGVVSTNGLATAWSCTSTALGPIRVGVEVFGAAGGGPLNNADTTSLSVASGATVLFATAASSLAPDSNLGVVGLTKGSSRILSTSKSLICTAFLVDQLSTPPASMTYLTIVAKTKQKAAN